jgi:hypothetical protein
MRHEQLIIELQDLAQQLGVKVRYEKGDFEGGFCVLREDRVLLINKRMMPPRKASVLATALHEIGLDAVFVKPVLREYIEDEVARMARADRQV